MTVMLLNNLVQRNNLRPHRIILSWALIPLYTAHFQTKLMPQMGRKTCNTWHKAKTGTNTFVPKMKQIISSKRAYN
jgi:hypothetical protein